MDAAQAIMQSLEARARDFMEDVQEGIIEPKEGARLLYTDMEVIAEEADNG